MSALPPGEPSSAVRPPEACYRAFFERSSDICLVLAPASGVILESNRSAYTVLGYSPEELVGRPVVSLAYPDDLKSAADTWQALARKLDLSRGALQLRRADGGRVEVEASATAVLGRGGLVAWGLAVLRPISLRQPGRPELLRCHRQLRTLAYEISVAEERERMRIATGLHDELGQLLAIAKLKLGQIGRLVQGEPARNLLDDLRALVAQATKATRSTTFELSPHVLHKRGLAAAIERLGERMERLYGLRVSMDRGKQPLPLGEETLLVLYRVVRELLFNVQKHAQASTAVVSLRCTGQHVVVRVEDDGVGFQVGTRPSESSPRRGFGLDSVEAQLEAIGGWLEIDSHLGAGTSALVTAPLTMQGSRSR